MLRLTIVEEAVKTEAGRARSFRPDIKAIIKLKSLVASERALFRIVHEMIRNLVSRTTV
jgi:L-lactate utilization protein LutC